MELERFYKGNSSRQVICQEDYEKHDYCQDCLPLTTVLADGCLAAARAGRAGDAGGRDRGDAALRIRLLATGSAAIEPLLGLRVPRGQSHQAEQYRLNGELLLERDGPRSADEAPACFQEALRLAREQGALAWELRAAMSLVRLRKRYYSFRSEAEREAAGGAARAAQLAEARDCLSSIYARFTEGFAFPDLQDAAVLLSD